jgi:hypothetical protein
VVISDQEGTVLENIKRKESGFETMQQEMVRYMADINSVDVKGIIKTTSDYSSHQEMAIPEWLKTGTYA